MDQMFVSLPPNPSNSYVEAITPNVMPFEGGAFVMYLGLHEVMRAELEPSREEEDRFSFHITNTKESPHKLTARRWPSAS